jgi:acetyltransferase-like isoleucine patch superfamily enzyme
MLFLKNFLKKKINYIKKNSTSIRAESEILNLSDIKENITIGGDTIIKGKLIVFPHSGKIKIGNYSYVGHGTEIWSAKNIIIGNRVLIAHNVNILDTDAHPSSSELRHLHFKEMKKYGFSNNKYSKINKNIKSSEIIIEDDVWIGIGAFIYRGVTIGKESVVAPMSYVIEDVPPHSVVSGNPATVVRYNKKNNFL